MNVLAAPATRQTTPIRKRGGWPVVFDNGGKSADQYSIIMENGDLLAASSQPFHPAGIGIKCGNIVTEKYGGFTSPKQFADEARANPDWLGKEVTDLSTLPDDVQAFIRQNR